MSKTWREIPEPDSLRDVLRTPGGMPVPWAAAWSSEDGGVLVKPDPIVARAFPACAKVPCLFEANGHPGEGTAKLAVISPTRQRESAVLLRCQVCRAEVGVGNPPWNPPLWLADLRSSQNSDPKLGHDRHGRQTINIGGRPCPLVYEPWLCSDCLVYSLRACNGLRSMRRHQSLSVWSVRSASFVETRESLKVEPRSGTAPSSGVLTYVKIAVTDGSEIHPAAILRTDRERRAA